MESLSSMAPKTGEVGSTLFVMFTLRVCVCVHALCVCIYNMSPIPSHLIILYAIVFFSFFFSFFFLGPRRIHLCGSYTRKSSVYLEKHCAQTRGYYSPNSIMIFLFIYPNQASRSIFYIFIIIFSLLWFKLRGNLVFNQILKITNN